MAQGVEKKAKLIESLAGTMTDNMWGDDILQRCRLIREALEEIEKSALSARSGEHFSR